MSIVDDAVTAIMPAPSAEDRAEARDYARRTATPGDWLSMILDHHEQLEAAFASTLAETSAESRTAAFKRLGVILTGHAGAEESVIYPAMDMSGETRHANHAYDEQVTVKKEMAALEQLDPLSADFEDKLEAVRTAVAAHMVEEEGTWFADLRAAEGVDQQMLTKRYAEEYGRYVGDGSERPAMNL